MGQSAITVLDVPNSRQHFVFYLPQAGRVHFAEWVNPGVEDGRLHVHFRPLRREVLAEADVKGEAEVAGPEVDTIVTAHRHLVDIFIEYLDSETLKIH